MQHENEPGTLSKVWLAGFAAGVYALRVVTATGEVRRSRVVR